jgi:hypothetical protein
MLSSLRGRFRGPRRDPGLEMTSTRAADRSRRSDVGGTKLPYEGDFALCRKPGPIMRGLHSLGRALVNFFGKERSVNQLSMSTARGTSFSDSTYRAGLIDEFKNPSKMYAFVSHNPKSAVRFLKSLKPEEKTKMGPVHQKMLNAVKQMKIRSQAKQLTKKLKQLNKDYVRLFSKKTGPITRKDSTLRRVTGRTRAYTALRSASFQSILVDPGQNKQKMQLAHIRKKAHDPHQEKLKTATIGKLSALAKKGNKTATRMLEGIQRNQGIKEMRFKNVEALIDYRAQLDDTTVELTKQQKETFVSDLCELIHPHDEPGSPSTKIEIRRMLNQVLMLKEKDLDGPVTKKDIASALDQLIHQELRSLEGFVESVPVFTQAELDFLVQEAVVNDDAIDTEHAALDDELASLHRELEQYRSETPETFFAESEAVLERPILESRETHRFYDGSKLEEFDAKFEEAHEPMTAPLYDAGTPEEDARIAG